MPSYNKYVKYFGDGIQGGEMILGLAPSLLSRYVVDNVEQAADNAANEAGNEEDGLNVGVDNNVESQLNVAGAFNFFGNTQAAENTNVAVGGSLALNQLVSNVDSVIKERRHFKQPKYHRAGSQRQFNQQIKYSERFCQNWCGLRGKQKVFAATSSDNVVRNQMEGTTTTKLENANVNHSGAVDVNALNTSKIKADGGVAPVALNISKTFFAALGAAVAVTNGTFDNEVTAQVDNSTINAAGDVNVQARDDHKFDGGSARQIFKCR